MTRQTPEMAEAGSARRRSASILRWTGAALLAVTAAGCGGDDVTGSSSNRGSGSETGESTVENAFIVPTFLPGECAIQVGSAAKMRFTVTNNSSESVERLEDVSTDVAEVADLEAPVEIAPRSTVAFGQPSAESVQTGTEQPALALRELPPDLKPGMSTDVTFHFDRAGEVTIPVPLEACPTQERPGP
ncbi:hypothetical protein ACAG25_20880 [Mycobacterium sp. pV006]|uniref:hypothetical protein n=1 Tax=Mycobacterium sp. pV006 TaxID=3238983 RepID=UPI00351B7384